MTKWENTLDKYSVKIEENLSDFLKTEIDHVSSYHSFIERLYKDLYEFIFRGGKRLASCSSLLIYKGYTNKVDERILSVCSAMELYRHSILVHDDLIDNDNLRRGAMTIHKLYLKNENFRFGNGVAVFAGNILYTLSIKSLFNSGFESNKILNVLKILNNAFQDVNESQLLDLLFECNVPSVDNWYVMASKRAVSLFEASMSIGAILADVSNKEIQLLRKAAEHIGYCFDIQDDIIDTFASEEQYGKRPGGDLSKNKKPLHIIYTLKMANKSQIKFIRNAIQKDPFQNLPNIRRIVSGCGALEKAKKRSIEHANHAKRLILMTKLDDAVKKFFISFIDYVKDSLDWYS